MSFWHNKADHGEDLRVLVIASQRTDVVRCWQAAWAQAKPGLPVAVTGDAEPAACQRLAGVLLVVVDRAILPEDRAGKLREWKQALPGVPVVLSGDSFSPERELAALGIGMSACCDHQGPVESLTRVIGVVLGGGVWISGPALPQLMHRLAVASQGAVEPASAAAASPLAQLTERQRAVAELLAKGESNKVIARQLNIADRTVKAHLSAIFEKLKVSDRLQLAVLLNRRGLPARDDGG